MRLLFASKGKIETGAASKKSKNKSDSIDEIKLKNKEGCVNGKCFAGGSLVYTKESNLSIKNILAGDDIYSRNEKTGETGFQKVEEVFLNHAHTIYTIEVDNKTEIQVTAYHPFYVEEQGWVNAISLQVGAKLQTMEGTATITNLRKERTEEAVPVYNFHVTEWVSYFVSELKVYVHNGNGGHTGNGGTLSDRIKEIQKKTPKQLLQEGWKDVTDPRKAQNTSSRDYEDPKTGLVISFDPEKPGETGFEAINHYHIHNPNFTHKKIDYYLDINGNPVGKGSTASHIVIQKGE